MFCGNCGKEIPEGAKFCPSCGTTVQAFGKEQSSFRKAVDDMSSAARNAADGAKETVNTAAGEAKEKFGAAAESAKESVNNAGKSVDSAISEVVGDFNGSRPAGGALKTDRSLLAYILLNIITCGIYGYYFIYSIARDINIACDDDEETTGLGMYILLSFITCGFYSLYWEYKLGNRLSANAPDFGLTLQENGTTILLWRVFGSLICGIGTFIGSYILIKNVNLICSAYNRKYGLS